MLMACKELDAFLTMEIEARKDMCRVCSTGSLVIHWVVRDGWIGGSEDGVEYGGWGEGWRMGVKGGG